MQFRQLQLPWPARHTREATTITEPDSSPGTGPANGPGTGPATGPATETTADLAGLEQARLAAYTDPASAGTPPWWWVALGALFGLYLGVYVSGQGLALAAMGILYAAGLIGLVVHRARRDGVSTPRLRGMPKELRRTYRPIWAFGVVAFGLLALYWLDRLPLHPVAVGFVAGGTITLAGLAHTAWYRRVAERLARDHGLPR